MVFGHAHIFIAKYIIYGVQIRTESYHALANPYMGSYSQKIKNEEPSLAIFQIYLSFVSHKNIWNMSIILHTIQRNT